MYPLFNTHLKTHNFQMDVIEIIVVQVNYY